MNKWKFVPYVVFHPIEGFNEMRYKKGESFGISILLYLLFVFSLIAQQKYCGLQFAFTDDAQVSIQRTLVSTLGLMVTAVFSNWGFCVLLEGKARLKEIWILINYALIPHTAFSFLYVILSNMATREEGMLLGVLMWIGTGWSAFLLLRALMTYHEFTFSGAIGSVVLTVVGVAIILFLLLLLVSLFQKVFSTFSVIFNEILFRFR